MKTPESIIQYLKQRTEVLGNIVGYYEALERDRGFMKSDDMLSYSIAQSQLNELERLVSFIEE